jgi:hypothetical protein
MQLRILGVPDSGLQSASLRADTRAVIQKTEVIAFLANALRIATLKAKRIETTAG